mmetsp:Transcript_16286/g.47632  ORF Transcript_16286/g.47632 Transcript_16286/m.47632 type:complete len:770 (-) Transcript_16286:76-2385(-)
MDPVLSARLQQQLDKCQTGASSVGHVLSAAEPLRRMDPILARRLHEQNEKVLSGHSAVEQVGSVADKTPLMDPLLVMRFDKQKIKLETGRSDVGDVGSAAGPSVQLDPVLARRLARQQDKLDTGRSDVEHVGSVADKSVQLEPRLAMRLERQKEKAETGKSDIENIQPTLGNRPMRTEPILARRLAEQRDKLETGRSAVEQVGSAAPRGECIEDPQLARLLAQRRALMEFPAGSRCEQKEGRETSAAHGQGYCTPPHTDSTTVGDQFEPPMEVANCCSDTEGRPLDGPPSVFIAAAPQTGCYPSRAATIDYLQPNAYNRDNSGPIRNPVEPPWNCTDYDPGMEHAEHTPEASWSTRGAGETVYSPRPALRTTQHAVESGCGLAPSHFEPAQAAETPQAASSERPGMGCERHGNHGHQWAWRRAGSPPGRTPPETMRSRAGRERQPPSGAGGVPPHRQRSPSGNSPGPGVRPPSCGPGTRRNRVGLVEAALAVGLDAQRSAPSEPRPAVSSPSRYQRERRSAQGIAVPQQARSPARQKASDGQRPLPMSPIRRTVSPARPGVAAAPAEGQPHQPQHAGSSLTPRKSVSPRLEPQPSTSPRYEHLAHTARGSYAQQPRSPAVSSGPGHAAMRARHSGEGLQGPAGQRPPVAQSAGGADTGLHPSPDVSMEASLPVREDTMHRGAFDLSRTTCKAPAHVMKELQRALVMQRVAYKKTSASVLRCEKQSLRFEVEVSRSNHLTATCVVRCRRLAGGIAACKELCARVLAEAKV